MRYVTIERIYSARYYETKFGERVLVCLGMQGEKNYDETSDFWLSLNQYNNLIDAFDGYTESCNKREVIAILDKNKNRNEYIKFVFGITPKKPRFDWFQERCDCKIEPLYIDLYDEEPVMLEDK